MELETEPRATEVKVKSLESSKGDQKQKDHNSLYLHAQNSLELASHYIL